jgi:PAS domain S-box-containing protein
MSQLFRREVTSDEEGLVAVDDDLTKDELRTRLQDAESILHAIANSEVDAFVVQTRGQEQVYTLRGADQPYRVIVESISEGAATLAVDGTIFYCNQTLARLLGLPLANVIGADLAEFVAPDDSDRYTRLLAQGSLEPSKGEVSLRAAAGRDVPVLLSCSPLQLDEVQGICIVVTDLTEQKRQAEHLIQTKLRLQQEMALRESEERFRSTFEQAAVGIAHTALSGVYLRVNQRFCDITGYSRAALTGRNVQDITHPDDLTLDLALRGKLLAGELNGMRLEKRLVRADGSPVWVQVTGSLAFDPDSKEPLYFISVVEDISERKALTLENERLFYAARAAERTLRQLNETLEERVAERTAELQRSNRELDRFAYVASHDLKAPLRAIDNLSKWIETDAREVLPPASREHLVKLRGRVQRMERLLDDLLAFSRAGRIQHAPEHVHTTALVRSVFDLLSPPADFRLLVDDNMPELVTQRVPLETVLRNLMGNAIKHHHRPDGSIQVSAKEFGDMFEFCVVDDGPGIAANFHERIFDLFQTLQPRDQVEGSGMGLAIVKKTVESMGGTICVDSDIGQGAAFRFTWPKK